MRAEEKCLQSCLSNRRYLSGGGGDRGGGGEGKDLLICGRGVSFDVYFVSKNSIWFVKCEAYPFLYIFVSMTLRLPSISLCLCLSASASCLFVPLSLFLFLSLSPYLSVSLSLSLGPSVFLYLCLLIYIFLCLSRSFFFRFFDLFVSRFLHFSIYQSLCLSVVSLIFYLPVSFKSDDRTICWLSVNLSATHKSQSGWRQILHRCWAGPDDAMNAVVDIKWG